MLQLQITKTTDGQNVGMIIEIPQVDEMGILTKEEIYQIATSINPQFKPINVIRFDNKVRLTDSNYSAELEQINA